MQTQAPLREEAVSAPSRHSWRAVITEREAMGTSIWGCAGGTGRVEGIGKGRRQIAFMKSVSPTSGSQMCHPWGFAGWGVFTRALEDGNNCGKRERQAGGRKEGREGGRGKGGREGGEMEGVTEGSYNRCLQRSVKWSEAKVTQSCLTLCYPMDNTVRGILQARILEWGRFSLLQGIFPTLQVDSLTAEPQGKPKNTGVGSQSLLQGIFPYCRQIPYQLSHQGSPKEVWDAGNWTLQSVKSQTCFN